MACNAESMRVQVTLGPMHVGSGVHGAYKHGLDEFGGELERARVQLGLSFQHVCLCALGDECTCCSYSVQYLLFLKQELCA